VEYKKHIDVNIATFYCIQTFTRHSWINYTDCWIVK